MLLIDRKQKQFALIPSSNFTDLEILERSDLQRMILASADPFFNEMGESLKLIGEEVRPSDFVSNRIDLLAIDADGAVVVIELKRDKDKFQLLQALSYAGMIAKWEGEDLIEQFASFSGKTTAEAKSEIEDFLDSEDAEAINQSQRVILIAEDYDYEVLITAEWLRNRYKMDVRCYRLALAKHGDNAFLSCTRIVPPAELTAHSIPPESRTAAKSATFPNLEALTKWIENDALREFVQKELAAKWDRRAARGRIRYRVENRTRVRVYVKREFAYVLQFGRFVDDEKFWRERLTPEAGVRIITHGRRLRFRLRTAEELAAFRGAWDNHVSKVAFMTEVASTEHEDDEDGEADQ